MGSRVTAILLVALPVAPAPFHDAQVPTLRAAVWSGVTCVCLAVNAGTLPSPVTKVSHLESTRSRPDPPAALLELLGHSAPAYVPASQCTRTEMEWDVINGVSGKPALLVVVGQVEQVTASHVRVVVLTTSGFMSDTHTLFDVEKVNGVWKVTSSTIILQA